MIAPLSLKKRSWKRIVLVASEETRKTTMPPPMVEIGEESLLHLPPQGLPTALSVEGVAPASAVRPERATDMGADDDDVDEGWDA
jgi:hypothetical protein